MFGSKAFRRSVRYTLVYWLIKSMITASGVLPRRWWLWICGFLGSVTFSFAAETRRLTLKHLKMAFPNKNARDIRKLARRTFKILGKNAGDILRSSRVKNLRGLEKFLVTHGLENYEVAHTKGKGVIFLTCHLGAFDLQITKTLKTLLLFEKFEFSNPMVLPCDMKLMPPKTR